MNILIFGPNGSGKGTQGSLAKKKYDLDHIESGAIFRKHIGGGTELGITVNAIAVRDEGERRYLYAAAARAGVSRAEWIRRAVVAALKVARMAP